LAESVAGALLEVLVHLELGPVRLPRSYRLLKVEAPDDVSIESISGAELRESWTEDETLTRSIGDEWLASKRSALLRVPSAVAPETFNVLFNTEHEDAAGLKIASRHEYLWDRRLISR
jgi:RES domain-containing protein